MSDLDELKAEWFEFGRKAGLKEAHRYQHQCNADLETRTKLREEGRELERERIIKVLEANCNCHTAMVRGYVKKFVCPAHGFIARIKADSNV